MRTNVIATGIAAVLVVLAGAGAFAAQDGIQAVVGVQDVTETATPEATATQSPDATATETPEATATPDGAATS